MSAHLKNVLKYFGSETKLLHTGLLARETFWNGVRICGDGFMLYVHFDKLQTYLKIVSHFFLLTKILKPSSTSAYKNQKRFGTVELQMVYSYIAQPVQIQTDA